MAGWSRSQIKYATGSETIGFFKNLRTRGLGVYGSLGFTDQTFYFVPCKGEQDQSNFWWRCCPFAKAYGLKQRACGRFGNRWQESNLSLVALWSAV